MVPGVDQLERARLKALSVWAPFVWACMLCQGCGCGPVHTVVAGSDSGGGRCAGTEWLVSVLIGLGVIPLSLLTRFITRAVFGVNVPREGDDRVDMDIGYGAVVDVPAETRSSDGDGELKSSALMSTGKEENGKVTP